MDDTCHSLQSNNSIDVSNALYSQESFPDLLSASVSSYNRDTNHYFNNQNCNMNIKHSNGLVPLKYHGSGRNLLHSSTGASSSMQSYAAGSGERNRYAPYYTNRPSYASTLNNFQYQRQYNNNFYGPVNSTNYSTSSCFARSETSGSTTTNHVSNCTSSNGVPDQENQPVTLHINNLDCSLDESSLRHFLSNQLKPITPIVSLTLEGSSVAKVTVPNSLFAKQVVSNLHRKRVGHKRMVVAYTKDSSLTESNTLRCQVAGLLKDVPYGTLSVCKFRELFQSRFKTSISVLDLTKMQDICNIQAEENEEKYISLNADFLNSINSSPLMECLQHSVPYCVTHFKRDQHKGWAEQDIEPLPNVFMTISEIQSIIYPLLKNHSGDIPITSIVHCIKGELGVEIKPNNKGVNLEHLICCIHGVQITTNSFGIKILGWLEPENVIGKDSNDGRFNLKVGATCDPLYQISRETIDLVKMSPKSTMKFNRFIPAYHNHFGKQCRVADYGYTKLIELFDAVSSVIQIMGDGEHRLITLHHRTQVRRFTSDLLRILRAQANKSILLSQMPAIFSQSQNRKFDITDYGVCDVVDILDGLVNSNTVVITRILNGSDILISIPKRKQTQSEMEKTSIFAGEVVELLRNASQYSVVFQKFVRSYHYHFGYQCRLLDYGFVKLTDLMEALQGIVEIESSNDENKRVRLSKNVAQRIFAEQLEDLVKEFSGCAQTCMQLKEVLQLHKKKYGYQIQPQILGVATIIDAVKILPYIELLEIDNDHWIICHSGEPEFRNRCYSACKIIQDSGKDNMLVQNFTKVFASLHNETVSERDIHAMKHAIEIITHREFQYLIVTNLMRFLANIIRLLDGRSMMLGEIKRALHLGITDCSVFGYPNLCSLLRAFWDIFIVAMAPSHDRSEVRLVSQGNVVSQENQHNQLKPLNSTSTCEPVSEKVLQPLALAETRPNSVDPLASQKFLSQYSSEITFLPLPTNRSNKENAYNSSFNGSLNSSILSDPNSSAGSTNGYSDCNPRFWNRHHDQRIHENQDTPVRPETSSFKKTPFWLDPIWTTNTNSLQIEPFKLNQQQFKSLNVLPMLMSPYTLSKISQTENTKQVFSFDRFDKMIP